MAMSPMKKKVVSAVIIGFLLMLLIAGAGAVVFYRIYAETRDELARAKKDNISIYVAKDNYLADGKTLLTEDSFILKEINKSALPNEYYTEIKESDKNSFKEAQLDRINEHTLIWPNKERSVYPKIDIPKGTIITMDMLWDETEKVTADMREQEYNMIVLPSLLKEGDYVDIRLLLPTGNDFVVATFKRVKKVTEGTVWFDLNEIDTQYISSAIIETCLTRGAMLYAVKYTEPTLQEETQITYAILPDVAQILLNEKNASLFTTDINELRLSYDEKRAIIASKLAEFQEPDPEKNKELIEKEMEERIQKQQEERATQIANGLFVDSGNMNNIGNMNNGGNMEYGEE